jgi:hypothetical protein
MARAPIMCRKSRGGLFPADAYGQSQYDALPDGKELAVRVTVMSSTGKTEREGMRGLWWGSMELLSQNVDDIEYDTKEKAHASTLFALGFVRPRFRIDGSVEMIPVSTAEDNMPDEEMAILLEKAAGFLTRKFGFDPFQSWKDEHEAANANRRYR